MSTIADLLTETLSAKVRAIIYTVLAALIGLEAIWDIVPDVLEGKLLATLSVLGFGLALVNTPLRAESSEG